MSDKHRVFLIVSIVTILSIIWLSRDYIFAAILCQYFG